MSRFVQQTHFCLEDDTHVTWDDVLYVTGNIFLSIYPIPMHNSRRFSRLFCTPSRYQNDNRNIIIVTYKWIIHLSIRLLCGCVVWRSHRAVAINYCCSLAIFILIECHFTYTFFNINNIIMRIELHGYGRDNFNLPIINVDFIKLLHICIRFRFGSV